MITVDPYDTYQVQLALDDMTPHILRKEFKETFTQIDRKLLVNTFLNVIGLFAIGYGFKYGFHPTKMVVGCCSAVYLVVSGLWNFYSMFMCKWAVFTGECKGKELKVCSKLGWNAVYSLQFFVGDKRFLFESSYEKYFTAQGKFLESVFKQDLMNFISSKIK